MSQLHKIILVLAQRGNGGEPTLDDCNKNPLQATCGIVQDFFKPYYYFCIGPNFAFSLVCDIYIQLFY